MATAEARTGYLGARVKRREDEPLLTGRGTFVDNMTPVGTLAMVVVRSPYAHARVTSLDLETARAADGVVAVFAAGDLQDDWKAAMPCAWPVTEDMRNPPHYPLTDIARYQGDGIAVVIAESRTQAKDAAELIEAEYDPLPVAVDVATALEEGNASRPSRARHERVLRLATRNGRHGRGNRERRCRRHSPVLAAAADPERD